MIQAHTLDAIFNTLAQRASRALDRYLRLGLKAQSQCRATLETLATIKNPQPVAFVRQANIAHGPQQLNNRGAAAASRAEESENPPNKVLEHQHAERLDFGTTVAAIGSDPAMATLGTFDAAEVREEGKTRVSRNAYKGGTRAPGRGAPMGASRPACRRQALNRLGDRLPRIGLAPIVGFDDRALHLDSDLAELPRAGIVHRALLAIVMHAYHGWWSFLGKIAGLGIEVSSARCWKGNNWFDMEITHEKSSHGRLRGHNPSCIVGTGCFGSYGRGAASSSIGRGYRGGAGGQRGCGGAYRRYGDNDKGQSGAVARPRHGCPSDRRGDLDRRGAA